MLEEVDRLGARWQQGEHEDAVMSAVQKKPWANKSKAGAKRAKPMERKLQPGQVLDPQQATNYRALSARANYLAKDRPDLGFARKELCRDCSVPNSRSLKKLVQVVRYVKGCPRLVHVYPWSQPCSAMTVFTDTDLAGCKVTRRITSGGIVMCGDHCVKAWSSTKPVLKPFIRRS